MTINISIRSLEKKMENVFVTVIIPVYNCEKYLSDCLNCILRQVLKNIEVICIDDGSTDGSGEILDTYARQDSRISVYHQPNAGPSAARNRGIALARGEYIQFCDSDDMLEKDALAYCYEKASQENLDVFYFDARSIYENRELEERKAIYKTLYTRNNIYGECQKGASLFVKLTQNHGFRSSPDLQFVRREFLEQSQVLFPEGILHEDNYFTVALMLCAERVAHEPKPFYIRRVRESSIMTVQESFRNVYGYFMNAHYLIDFLYAHQELDSAARLAAENFAQQLFRRGIDMYLRIPAEEQARIRELSDDQQANFLAMAQLENIVIPYDVIDRCFTVSPVDCFLINTINRQLEDTKHKTLELQQQLSSVKSQLKNEKGKNIALQKQLTIQTQVNEKIQKQCEEIKMEQQRIQFEFDCMSHSLSFRVGRVITFIPRKLRNGVRCYREHGVAYTIRRTLWHLGLVSWKEK